MKRPRPSFLNRRAAADLHPHGIADRMQDVVDRLSIAAFASKGSVEIDDVHPGGAGGGEGLSSLEGIDVVGGLARVVALGEADGLEQFHCPRAALTPRGAVVVKAVC